MQPRHRTLTLTLLVTLMPLLSVANADANTGQWASAKREANESWQQARERFEQTGEPKDVSLFLFGRRGDTASNVAAPMAELSFASLPDWGRAEILQQRFVQLRDERFLNDLDHPGFPRRISWLYPDDGCFARASVAGQRAHESGWLRPGKLFAFGDLSVSTSNSDSGRVYWWYHVAAAVRVRHQVFVIDPSIEPLHPLSLEEWAQRMSDHPEELRFSVCMPSTYLPGNLCYKPGTEGDSSALSDEEDFLRLEWTRIETLGRNPEKELGPNPPWNYFF